TVTTLSNGMWKTHDHRSAPVAHERERRFHATDPRYWPLLRGLGQQPPRRVGDPTGSFRRIHRRELVREDLDANRCLATDAIERPHELDDVTDAVAGEEPRPHRLLGDRLVHGFRGGVAELHAEDTIARDRGEVGGRGAAARAVPRVDEHTTVRTVGEPD